MKKVLITGGSGLIGRRLTTYLEKQGIRVAWLTRNPQGKKQKSFGWDPANGQLEEDAMTWPDAIVHLAGAGIADKRWTADRKQLIRDSRVHSTQLLYNSLQKLDRKPEAFISASAVGYYGFDPGSQLLNEEAPVGNDFLAKIVEEWEQEALKIQSLGLRVMVVRTGVVLSSQGGALKKMLMPPIAAPLGDGKQYMSWIHLDDLTKLYGFAVTEEISGIYNGVAPHPVTNRILTKTAAKEKGKPYIPVAVPSFMVKMIAGEMGEMVLGGSKVSSKNIQNKGFIFKFPLIQPALSHIYAKKI